MRSSITWLRRSSRLASATTASSSATRSGGVTAAHWKFFVEPYPDAAAATFLIPPGLRRIHEDSPHQASGHRQKVRAVLPIHLLDVDQSKVRLVAPWPGRVPERSPAMQRCAIR
jgi:hypothetical protein